MSDINENGSLTTTTVTAKYSALRADYSLHNRLSTQAIAKIVKKFEDTVVVTNIKRPVHHCFTRSSTNIAILSESVAKDPNVSIPCRSQELELSYGKLWHILHLDLHLHSYKVQLT